MLILLKNPAQIVTIDTNRKNSKRGNELQDVGLIENHSIIIENGIIKDITPNAKIKASRFDKIIDATDKVVLPGIVECHTHTIFAGSRANEFRKRLDGASYEEIAASGGGINTTVQAVRKCSFEELIEIVRPRIDYFISQGVTTLEIKSGYGLSFYDEIKLLQVIKYFNQLYPIDIVPTFLGAHTFPREYKNDHNKYVDIIIREMIPYIAKNNLAVFCDGFCEKTAFSAKQIGEIFAAAKNHGMKLKLHTEQFNNIGGLEMALNHDAVSVDHLEVLTKEQLANFSSSDTVAVLLPGVSYFLDYSYAPARELIANNAILALATDYNPGSSNISNISLIMSLAAIKMGMTVEEVLSAYTINAAKALSLEPKIGSIEIGKQADFAIFEATEYSEIVYNTAKNINVMTVKHGELIYPVNNMLNKK